MMYKILQYSIAKLIQYAEPTTHRSTGSLFILSPADIATETIEAVASYLEIGWLLVNRM